MYSKINKVLTFAGLLSISLTTQAQTWLKNIVNENPDVIDSIVVNRTDVYADRFGYSSYHIYYHQPLTHANPDGEQMPLRAVLLIRKGVKFESALTQCHSPGYNIDDVWWNTPSLYMGNWYYPDGANEIAKHYNGNWVYLEHRYFGQSVPKNYWKRVEYCTAEEAAADYHALITALKTSLKGKWVRSGGSKGGKVTAYQHAYYPDDVDLYIPYSAPFCDGTNDMSMMAYWTTYPWTEDLRNEVKTLQRRLVKSQQSYQYFKSWSESNFPGYSANMWRSSYLKNIAIMDFDAHSYWSRQALIDTLAINEVRKQALMKKGLSSDYLDAVMVYYCTLSSYEAWNFLSTYGAKHRVQEVVPVKNWIHKVFRPVSISLSKWNVSTTAFDYQALHEDGYFGVDFTYLFDADEQQLAQQCNKELVLGNPYILSNPFNEPITFDSTLRDKVLESTRAAKRPILYIYGGDDTWTGAAIPDDCIDNQMSHKYILSAQNHGACITNTKGSLNTKLWNLVDQLLNTPAGIEENVKIEKLKNEGIYDLRGQRQQQLQRGINIVNGRKVMVK